MEIEKIREANEKVIKLNRIQRDIEKLTKTTNIGSVELSHYSSSSYDYKVSIDRSYDYELMQTIKSLVLDRLKRTEKRLLREIDNI